MQTLTAIRRTFRFASHPKSLNMVKSYVTAQLKAFSYGDRDSFAIHLALEEALMNAVQHGNGNDASKLVNVELIVDEEHVAICVEDEGDGFCVADVKDPLLAECIELPHGRGIFLMRNFMDSVHYNLLGNEVTLIRRRSVA